MERFKKYRWVTLVIAMVFSLAIVVQPCLAFIVAKTQPALNKFIPLPVIEGGMVLSKTVEHPFGAEYVIPENVEFGFEVDLGAHYADFTLSTTEGEMTCDENGVLEVTLRPNEYIGIENLDDGMTVTVTELPAGKGFAVDGDASQSVVISADDTAYAEFVNIYTPEPVSPGNTLDVDVEIEGRPWQEGDSFEVVLEMQDANGNWYTVAVENAVYGDGEDYNKISFSEMLQSIQLPTVGDWVFRITETVGDLENMIYDSSVKTFTITVGDADMDGYLEIQKVTPGDGITADGYDLSAEFVNIYQPVTTTSTTTSTTTTSTTTTTTTLPPDVVLEDSYVKTIETTHGYYFSHDIRGFNRGQIILVEIENIYSDGTVEIVDVTDQVDFGGANPENTYKRTQTDFTYQVQLWLGDAPLTYEDGSPVYVTAYIGVKGDADLSNDVDSLDASIVLTYYSNVQTSPTLDKSIKFSKDDYYLDGLAAFLSDCDANEFDEKNFAREKVQRTIDALDASYILTFYSYQQTMPLDTLKYDIWMLVVPDRMLTRYN